MATWKTTDGIQSLQVPQGTAVLCCWLNPSYVYGVILPANGTDPIAIPPTDWFANQAHIPRHLHRKYDSAFEAARAFCEWKLQSLTPPAPATSAYDAILGEPK